MERPSQTTPHPTDEDSPDSTDENSTGRSLNAIFDCLAGSDRRRILGILDEHAPDSMTQRALATRLVSTRVEQPNHADITEQDRETAVQQTLLELHHTQLPKLVDVGLIEHDADRDTVRTTDHPAYADEGIIAAIDPDPEFTSDSLDRLFDALAHERRRTVLDVLSHQMGPIHTDTLVRELVATEQGIAESEVPAETADAVLTDLVHVHLLRLADAGLIEYDPDQWTDPGAQTVAYVGHPQLYVPWMHSVYHDEFRPRLTGETAPDGMGELEGREQVISFGQALCDRAEDELFLMVTGTDMLEAGCLTRLRDASHRGTDVYLGTRDPDIREYVRENAPGVVLWEPDSDWLNLPASGDRVGRLLLADREAVMLGTVNDAGADAPDERAIVGEGDHNTMVTMISQLLGPHLEEIDVTTEAVDVRLPV